MPGFSENEKGCQVILKAKKNERGFFLLFFSEWVHMPGFRHLNENICVMGREAERQENRMVDLLHYELQSYSLQCCVCPVLGDAS